MFLQEDSSSVAIYYFHNLKEAFTSDKCNDFNDIYKNYVIKIDNMLGSHLRLKNIRKFKID